MSDKKELSPAEELTTGISVTVADLNMLMKNAVGVGLRVWLETRSEYGPAGSYPQIEARVYKLPAGIKGSNKQ